MKYILAIWVVIVLIGLLIISLVNLEEYGTNGIILAGISAFALFRIFKFLFNSGDPDEPEDRSISSRSTSTDPLEYIVYGELSGKGNPDDWDDY